MARLFISYSHKDREMAKALARALKALGHQVPWDDDLRSDQTYKPKIEQWIAQAHAVIVIWSTNSLASDWVKWETELALAADKLLSVRFSEFDENLLPEAVEPKHVEQLRAWEEARPAHLAAYDAQRAAHAFARDPSPAHDPVTQAP